MRKHPLISTYSSLTISCVLANRRYVQIISSQVKSFQPYTNSVSPWTILRYEEHTDYNTKYKTAGYTHYSRELK